MSVTGFEVALLGFATLTIKEHAVNERAAASAEPAVLHIVRWLGRHIQ